MVAGFVTRKLLHVVGLGALLLGLTACLEAFGLAASRMGVLVALAVLLVADTARIMGRRKVPLLQFILKKKESDAFFGLTFAVASAAVLLYIVDQRIALVALAMMVAGDPAAALMGRFFGSGQKSSVGTVSCFLVCAGVGAAMLGWSVLPVLMAAAATAGERYAGALDDNLVMPLAAGIVGQAFL